MTFSEITRLGGVVFAAVSLIVLGDTFGKLLTQQSTPPAFIAFSRFFLGVLVILPMSGLKLSELRGLASWRILLRGAFISGAIMSILTALQTEPIANVFGAFFIGPIVAYIGAILFLNERPRALRSLLLGLGFLGVLLVVKPSLSMSIGMVFALLSGCFYGCFIVATRILAGSTRPRLLLLSQLVLGSIILLPFNLGVTIPEPDLTLYLWILGSALASTGGNYLLVLASRRAEASLIAPLIYTQLIAATFFGLIVFQETPDSMTFLGLSVILASGFGSLWLQLKETQNA